MQRAIILILAALRLCVAERIPSDEAFTSSSVQDDDFYKQDVGDPEKLRVIIGDGSGWVNPHNMFSYSSSAKINRDDGTREQSTSDSADEGPISEDTVTAAEKALLRSRKAWPEPKLSTAKAVEPAESRREEPPATCDPCDCKCREMEKDLEKCQNDLQAVRLRAVLSDVESPQAAAAGCDKDRQFVYLRRLALSLVYNAKFGRRNIQSKVKLSILLSPEEVSTLEQLAQQSESQSSELESHLSAILASSTVIPQGELPNGPSGGPLASVARAWADLVGDARAEWAVPGLALLGVLLFAALRGAPWRLVFLGFVVYLLFASFIWHWVHTYKVSEAHREAFLSQNVAAAAHCTPMYSPGFLERVQDFLSPKRIDCQKYYEEIRVDPLWRVSPTMVASELIWRAVLHPLSFAGRYLGHFFNDFFNHLSWWSLLPATIILPIVLFVLAALCSGYTIIFPFGLGALGPPGTRAGPRVERPENVARIREGHSGNDGGRELPPVAAVASQSEEAPSTTAEDKEAQKGQESPGNEKDVVFPKAEVPPTGYVQEFPENVVCTNTEEDDDDHNSD